MSNNIPFMFPNGILNGSNPNPTYGYNVGAPVLATGPQPLQPALSGPTGNARGSSRMPQYPNNKINMMGEGLMRMGGSALSAINEGPVAQLGAMFNTYGDVRDYNRAQDLAQYQAEEDRRLEEQRRQDLLRKLNAKSTKDSSANAEDLAMADYQIETMETILAGLEEGGLTGLFDGTTMKWIDRLGLSDWWTGTDEGSKRAYLRQLLQEFKVDQTLTKTAHTKGAISNQEMALFMSPFPDIALDNEGAWIPQIKKRLEIAKKIRAFHAGETYTPPSTSTTPTVDQSVIDEANEVIKNNSATPDGT